MVHLQVRKIIGSSRSWYCHSGPFFFHGAATLSRPTLCFWICIYFCYFKTGYHCVTGGGLELTFIVLPFPGCWTPGVHHHAYKTLRFLSQIFSYFNRLKSDTNSGNCTYAQELKTCSLATSQRENLKNQCYILAHRDMICLDSYSFFYHAPPLLLASLPRFIYKSFGSIFPSILLLFLFILIVS